MKTTKEIAEEYIQLKKSKRALEDRLKELRAILIKSPETIKAWGLELQERDLTTYNQDKVHEVLLKKGWEPEDYCTYTINPSKLEELYLDGALTDDDLRYIREPKYGIALVEVGSEKDV